MVYIDPDTKKAYSHPNTKDRAITLRDHLYSDAGGWCMYCDRDDPLRYVSDDQCYSCLIEGCTDPISGDVWEGVNGLYRELAGSEFFTEPKGCKGGSHLVKFRKGTRRCVTCEELRAKAPRKLAIAAGEKWYMPDTPCNKCNTRSLKRVDNGQCQGCTPSEVTISPRQAALTAGETWYMPDNYCKRCNTQSLKRVNDGRCKGCAPPKVKAKVDEVNPLPADTIMDRVTARSLGFKHYRTGAYCKRGHTSFRYVSTGQCCECLAAI